MVKLCGAMVSMLVVWTTCRATGQANSENKIYREERWGVGGQVTANGLFSNPPPSSLFPHHRRRCTCRQHLHSRRQTHRQTSQLEACQGGVGAADPPNRHTIPGFRAIVCRSETGATHILLSSFPPSQVVSGMLAGEKLRPLGETVQKRKGM